MKNRHLLYTLSLLLLCCMLGCILNGCKQTNSFIVSNTEGSETMEEYRLFLDKPENFPCSFVYNGKQYTGFGDGFQEIGRENTSSSEKAEETTLKFRHTPSGAVFTVVARVYSNYSAYEWTVYIQNDSDSETGVFSELNAADIVFKGENPRLKGIMGDLGDMYAPYEKDVVSLKKCRFESTSGRPTHGNFPYFNLEYGNGGSFVALGWPGTWEAEFTSISKTETRLICGQRDLATKLAPGESIRTPLVAFLKYEGRNTVQNMNLWRRWFIDCSMRHVEGEENIPLKPVFSTSTLAQGMDESKVLRIIRAFEAHNVPVDYFWLDAGWYVNADGVSGGWPETGTLQMDTSRFPTSLRAVSDELASYGGKLLLWFEPEVVRLDVNKFLKFVPEFDRSWMLGTAQEGTWLEGQLLDLGNKDLRSWMLGRICKVIDDGGVSLYRQDFNVDPAPVWAECDAAAGDDRKGFTENQYVSGYLTLWDELIERYPDMMIDSCASGGGRNDLETLRRSVPLHCSDFWDGNDGGYDERQAVMQSLIAWFPYFKLQTNADKNTNMYLLRSSYAPWFNVAMSVMDKNAPWELVGKAKSEWEAISSYFYADYYPLTAWSKSPSAWRGWEFFDSTEQSGYMQLFRGTDSTEESMRIILYGLENDNNYRLTDMDGNIDTVMSGKELMENGIEIILSDPGSSAVIMISAEQ